MPLEFKNLRQEKYYIKSKKTSKGNTTYFMTKKEDGECLESLPEGYEVFEKYDARTMFIRKIKGSNFHVEEIKIIENALKSNDALFDYKLDICGDEIKIYISEQDGMDEISKIFENHFLTTEKRQSVGRQFNRYEEQMRINLKEVKNSRVFVFSRYSYRSSVDDWITIDTGEDLESMTKRYLIHLGKESYHDLF